jgi:hypothetical protein
MKTGCEYVLKDNVQVFVAFVISCNAGLWLPPQPQAGSSQL